MFTIVFQKTNNHIVHTRYDTSTGEKMSIENVFANYIEGNNLNMSDYEVLEIPYVKFSLIIGKHIYNKTTGQIDINPDYIPPPSPIENTTT